MADFEIKKVSGIAIERGFQIKTWIQFSGQPKLFTHCVGTEGLRGQSLPQNGEEAIFIIFITLLISLGGIMGSLSYMYLFSFIDIVLLRASASILSGGIAFLLIMVLIYFFFIPRDHKKNHACKNKVANLLEKGWPEKIKNEKKMSRFEKKCSKNIFKNNYK